jgi:hypothetical protein
VDLSAADLSNLDFIGESGLHGSADLLPVHLLIPFTRAD